MPSDPSPSTADARTLAAPGVIPPPTADDMTVDFASAYGDILGRLESDAPFDVGVLVVVGVAAIRRCRAAEAENARLRGIVMSLTERVNSQSELLSRRAEKAG